MVSAKEKNYKLAATVQGSTSMGTGHGHGIYTGMQIGQILKNPSTGTS